MAGTRVFSVPVKEKAIAKVEDVESPSSAPSGGDFDATFTVKNIGNTSANLKVVVYSSSIDDYPDVYQVTDVLTSSANISPQCETDHVFEDTVSVTMPSKVDYAWSLALKAWSEDEGEPELR